MTKEQDLLDHILSTPETKGSAQKVVAAIDEWVKTHRMMIIGKDKGKIVLDKIYEKEPNIMIELGCYVGYSAILFGSVLDEQNKKRGGPPAKYYSFEVNATFAGIATQMIDWAGLSHVVEIRVGAAGQTLPDFRDDLSKQFSTYTPADIVFIDHAKELYVPDLRVLESLSLIAPKTVILADNILRPGVPDYVKYVEGSPQYRRDHNMAVANISNSKFQGRWNILYESELVRVTSPDGREDGVEISTCESYLSG